MKKLLKILMLLSILVIIPLSIKSNANPTIICIDPGHGGEDGGASVGDVYEKTLDLSYSLTLKDILEQNGYKVVLTRTTDDDLSKSDKFVKKEDLQKRVDIINNSGCKLFLSIHMNKFEEEQYSGAQVFYYNSFPDNKILALDIQNALKNNLKNTTRDIKEIDSVYLLKNAKKIGCLVECGFMSNKKELDLLLNKDYEYKLCSAICDGVNDYLEKSS